MSTKIRLVFTLGPGWLGLLLGLAFAVAVAAAAAGEAETEIAYLIRSVAESDYQFVRNGDSYPGPEAAEHLRKKYEYRADRIHSAQDFIDSVASGSWLSGEPYQVITDSGQVVPTRDWLSQRLAEYRARPDRSPPGQP